LRSRHSPRCPLSSGGCRCGSQTFSTPNQKGHINMTNELILISFLALVGAIGASVIRARYRTSSSWTKVS
jgi:hypothetical protein